MSSDSPANSAPAPPPRADLPPLRLRLHHLFALTAVIAIILAMSGPRDLSSLDVSPLLQLAFDGLGIIYAILAAVAITFVVYGIAWRRRGRRFFDEPGHWLLVTIVVNQLFYTLLQFSVWLLARIQGQSTDEIWAELPQLVNWLAPGLMLLAVNVYIGRTKCHERHWTGVFYGKAAAALVPVIGDLLVLLLLEKAVRAENRGGRLNQRWRNAPGYVPPVVAAHRPAQQRGAAHRCGVGIQFALSGMQILIVFSVFGWMFWRFFAT